MREVVIPRYGAPEVMEMRERPDPSPAEGEVRIRVRAAGVNFADLLARMGLYPDAPKPPMVVGYEVAGSVDACGSNVSTCAAGDRVLAMTKFGGYSDTVIVPATFVFKTPQKLSDTEAAAVPVNYVTAMLALYRMANVTAGETVLVHGAGGGVGIAATQLSRLRRATIIGTASAGKHEALRSYGVDHVIDYRHANVENEVRRITKGRGVDIVLDPLGGESFAASYRMLAPLGRLVMYGYSGVATGERRTWRRVFGEISRLPRFHPVSLIKGNKGVFGLSLGHLWTEPRLFASMMETLLDEMRIGRLLPVVSRTFPLDAAADAHRFIQNRSNIGKVVLTT